MSGLINALESLAYNLHTLAGDLSEFITSEDRRREKIHELTVARHERQQKVADEIKAELERLGKQRAQIQSGSIFGQGPADG